MIHVKVVLTEDGDRYPFIENENEDEISNSVGDNWKLIAEGDIPELELEEDGTKELKSA